MPLKARMLKPEEVEELLSLKKDDITLDMLRKMFANGRTWTKKYETYDKFKLPAGRYYNKTEELTTPGRYIFNLVVLPDAYLKKHGYVNKEIDGKGAGAIESQLG